MIKYPSMSSRIVNGLKRSLRFVGPIVLMLGLFMLGVFALDKQPQPAGAGAAPNSPNTPMNLFPADDVLVV